jgi:antitoxin VapB
MARPSSNEAGEASGLAGKRTSRQRGSLAQEGRRATARNGSGAKHEAVYAELGRRRQATLLAAGWAIGLGSAIFLVYIGISIEESYMSVARTRTFRSGNSEAVRLPKEVAFGENVELVIVRSGDVMTIYKAKMTVQEMVTKLRSMPTPPDVEVRDTDEIPERVGL